jgi:hypothetical protein
MAAGERSLAVRLELLDDEATLTEERIDAPWPQPWHVPRAFRRPPARLTIEGAPMPTDDTPEDRVILPSLETPTLTKAELAELLFDRLGLNKRESKDMVEAFFEIVHGTWSTATT